MKNINQFILEKFKINSKNINKELSNNEVKKKLYNFLKDPKFKLHFDKNDENIMIGNEDVESLNSNKYDKKVVEKIEKFMDQINIDDLNDIYIYSMAVFNSCVTDFDDKPSFSQGEIIFHENNTEDRYWISVNKYTGDSFIFSSRKHKDYFGKPYYFKL